MILGILSDTHGNGRVAAAGLSVLRRAGAEAFVHCGDVGGEAILEQLAGLRVWFVWGNTDAPGPLLIRRVRELGLTPPAAVPLRLELGGRGLAVFHGHEAEFASLVERINKEDPPDVKRLLGGVDYVLTGHSHRPHDERIGGVRFINPGALHRARPHSVATLDLAADAVHFWEVRTESAADDARLIELPWALTY